MAGSSKTTLYIALTLLIFATFAIVWQADIIQQQKHVIRDLSGFRFNSTSKAPGVS